MDQLKEIWRTIRRIHFWLILVTVLLMSTVMWFFAVGRMSDEKDKNAKKYEGLFGNVNQQVSKPRVANQAVAADMQNLIDGRIEEISEAWAIKFEMQNSEEAGILTWPAEIAPPPRPGLPSPFVQHMEALRPIEKMVSFPSPDDERALRIGWRENYQEYIYKDLQELAASIGSEWPLDGKTAGAGGGGYGDEGYGRAGGGGFGTPSASGESLASQTVVDWNPANQADLLATHFTWGQNGAGGATGGFSDEPVPPNVLEVLYAQEDLWVLRALMKIIEETNDGANTRFNAAVKSIDSIHIGKDAVESTGRILMAKGDPVESEDAEDGGAGGGSEGYGDDGGYGDEGYGREGGESSDGGMYHDPNATGEGEDDGGDGGYGDGGYGGEGGGGIASGDPAEGRYVDKDYKPLSAGKLRAVMSSTETMEPEDAYLAVAKRIPVRMRISIDQRKLPELLVACANARLTVEVRQLRLNPEDVAAVGGGGIVGGYGERGGGLGGTGGRNGAANAKATSTFPFDVTVELYGIVYIYNPVDDRALGVEADPGDVSQWPVPALEKSHATDHPFLMPATATLCSVCQ